MINTIKKLFQAAEVKVNQNNEALDELSEQELQAIAGGGVKQPTVDFGGY